MKTFSLGVVVFLAALAGTQLGSAGFTPLHAGYANRVNGGTGQEWLTSTLKTTGQPDKVVMYDAALQTLFVYDWKTTGWRLTSMRNCQWDLLVREYPSSNSKEKVSNGGTGSIKSAVIKLVEKTEEWKKHERQNKYKRKDRPKALEKFALQLIKGSKTVSLFAVDPGTGLEQLAMIDRENERALVYTIDTQGNLELQSARQLSEELTVAEKAPKLNLNINLSSPQTVGDIEKIVEKLEQKEQQAQEN